MRPPMLVLLLLLLPPRLLIIIQKTSNNSIADIETMFAVKLSYADKQDGRLADSSHSCKYQLDIVVTLVMLVIEVVVEKY